MPEEKKEPIRVKDLLLMTIYSLEGKAWAYLGLISHPETKEPKKDTGEARLAIDAIDAIYKLIEERLSAEEKKDLELRLTNLRLNFVKNQ
ncbi:DUF1844 domain-containing protein [candidate division WOR-3 bacterium]|uniref:DUF1844 domain-containing protein n=1 Tax=candidate division WOR-3 bacterium TaxID=2052148 RepID=A0A660SK46_UNCW3|nr:MAG: DUF1844 domain-containing protein [candidate division WOR-3 bacterium]